jgi:hypothetical protein
MKNKVVKIVKLLTFNKVRGQNLSNVEPDLKWWWTPWTYRFAHNGWVMLDIRWLWRFRNGDRRPF